MLRIEERDTSLENFFQDRLAQALRETGVQAEPLTTLYLVRLLTGYAAQPIDEQPLALRLLEACSSAGPERRHALRDIGDTSLYVSGFWSDSFGRRVIDVDYYIGVGESAYGELSRRSEGWRRDARADVFSELSAKFSGFVRVLTAVSDEVMPAAGPQDIVRLYERWRKTGSTWALKRLAAMGVVLAEDNDGEPH